MLKTTLHTYQFNISNPAEREAYDKLRAQLQDHKLFNIYPNKWSTGVPFSPGEHIDIELETENLLNNQWNTAPIVHESRFGKDGLRVFDWYESILNNRSIKSGHYLDLTPEMLKIREITYQCGYCGAYYPEEVAHVQLFCNKCLSNEHLKAEGLRLLRLVSVSARAYAKYPELTVEELTILMPQYVAARKDKTSILLDIAYKNHIKARQKVEQDYKDAIHEAETEHEGYLWLLDNGIGIENAIFYSHTNRWCFGWRTPMQGEELSRLLDIVSEFPFDYDIKRKS